MKNTKLSLLSIAIAGILTISAPAIVSAETTSSSQQSGLSQFSADLSKTDDEQARLDLIAQFVSEHPDLASKATVIAIKSSPSLSANIVSTVISASKNCPHAAGATKLDDSDCSAFHLAIVKTALETAKQIGTDAKSLALITASAISAAGDSLSSQILEIADKINPEITLNLASAFETLESTATGGSTTTSSTETQTPSTPSAAIGGANNNDLIAAFLRGNLPKDEFVILLKTNPGLNKIVSTYIANTNASNTAIAKLTEVFDNFPISVSPN